MTFDIETGPEILRRTPSIIASLVRDLPESWTHRNEGPDTWSVFDVLGHLIHGEETDWIPRARVILEHGSSRAFEPFDRFAQFEASNGKSLSQLLDEIAAAVNETDCRLVLLSTHGKAGLEGFFTGSVAAKILDHVRQPVILLRSVRK